MTQNIDKARNIDKASFAASAAKAGAPELRPGYYPRAHPIEVFGNEDGSCDFAFVWKGKWHRLPLSSVDHAAVEIGISAEAYVSPLNYATGVVFFLAALERLGWYVSPPKSNTDIEDSTR